jgi:hypothetical protein
MKRGRKKRVLIPGSLIEGTKFIREVEPRHGKRRIIVLCGRCGKEKENFLNQILAGSGKLCQSCQVSEKNMANEGSTLSAESEIYRRIVQSAKKRGIDFKLTRPEVIDLSLQNCHYCGAEPNNKTEVTKILKDGTSRTYTPLFRNGIDRKDNSEGYEINNVVTCCKICNRAKNSMNYDDFVTHLNNLSKFRVEL